MMSSVHPVAPDRLSYSQVTKWRECPRRWYRSRITPEPPSFYTLRGVFAHRVLQVNDDVEVDSLKHTARWVWENEVEQPGPEGDIHRSYVELALPGADLKRLRWEAWNSIVASTSPEAKRKPRLHAELKVELKLGGVPFRGFVDRIEGWSGGLTVRDWKTGKPKDQFAKTDDHDQMLLYTAAVTEMLGEQVKHASRIFLGDGRAEVRPAPLDQVPRAIERLQITWGEMQDALTAEHFPAKPGPLCGWCPNATTCPEGAKHLLEERIPRRGLAKAGPQAQALLALDPEVRARLVAGDDAPLLADMRAKFDVAPLELQEGEEPFGEVTVDDIFECVHLELLRRDTRPSMLAFYRRQLAERDVVLDLDAAIAEAERVKAERKAGEKPKRRRKTAPKKKAAAA